MAATYVKITRTEFEDWLFALCPVFERVDDTAGIYLCPLTKHVAVKISSSIGRSDKVIAKSEGACRMTIVSRHDGRHDRNLPRPPGTDIQTHTKFNRTKGWRDNWRDGLLGYFDTFKAHQDHYTAEANKTQEEYAKEWVARIDSVKDYTRFDILVDCRKRLLDGKWLTAKQEAAIWKFVRPFGSGRRKKKKATKKDAKPSRSLTSREQTTLLSALSKLETAAKKAGDSWTVKFVTGNVRQRAQSGRGPTTRQTELLREKLHKYKIHVPAALAA